MSWITETRSTPIIGKRFSGEDEEWEIVDVCMTMHNDEPKLAPVIERVITKDEEKKPLGVRNVYLTLFEDMKEANSWTSDVFGYIHWCGDDCQTHSNTATE